MELKLQLVCRRNFNDRTSESRKLPSRDSSFHRLFWALFNGVGPISFLFFPPTLINKTTQTESDGNFELDLKVRIRFVSLTEDKFWTMRKMQTRVESNVRNVSRHVPMIFRIATCCEIIIKVTLNNINVRL